MGNDKEEKTMTEYEKQRLLRIRENNARLEALGLPGLSSSFRSDLSKQEQAKSASASTALNKSKKKKKKTTNADEEEEYQPSDEDDEEEELDEEPTENRSSEGEMPCTSSSRRKGKSGISHLKRGRKDGDFINDDIALAKAIALSLGESVENENGGLGVQNKSGRIRMSNSNSKKELPCKKLNKKPNKSRIQLTEDEVIAFFFSFDEVGKGYITAYDIEKMAIAHDFTWTDDEISKMVRSFDSDGDRKLNLEDFRSIVSRCHMLQGSE